MGRKKYHDIEVLVEQETNKIATAVLLWMIAIILISVLIIEQTNIFNF